MKVLVTYDSLVGNDEMLARAAADELKKKGHQVHCEKVTSATLERAEEAELIVISSPTRISRTTRKLKKFAAHLETSNKRFLLLGTSMAFMVRRGARAGVEHLADILDAKGAKLITTPQLFAIKGLSPFKNISSDEVTRCRQFITSLELQ